MNNLYIPYGKQSIDEDDIKAVVDVLKSDFITTGPKIEEFERKVADYVGAKYAVAMNGVDYIIFTGGIGENQINIRKGICEKLEFMGVKLNLDNNNMRGEEKVISTDDSKIKVYVIPTNEELMIAKETKRLIENK